MRFINDLATWQRPWADVHILYRHGTDGFWNGSQPAQLHRKDTEADALRFIRQLNPDIVHHHFPWGMFLVKHLLEEFPLIGTAHGWMYGCTEDCEVGDWVHPVGGPLPTRICLGIDIDAYPIKKHSSRREITVGLVGRRSPEKIPESFLQQLALGIPEGIKIRVIGSGLKTTTHANLTKLLSQLPVEIVGDIPQSEMPAAYQELDALIIPSSRESASYVAIEAMASGLPVVGRAVEGLPYTLGDAGLLGKTDEELLQHLVTLRDQPNLRTELGKRGRVRAEQLFNLPRLLRDYDQAYSDTTGGFVRAPTPNLDCSVVIPVYNTPVPWLRESLDSVLSQEGQFEVVIIDDASTEEATITELNHYASTDSRIRLFRSEINGGIGVALNHGVREARSDLILRFDSDDVCLPGRLAAQVAYMKEHPEVALLSGQMELMNEQGEKEGVTNLRYYPDKPMWAQPHNVNPILHPTVALRRAAVFRSGNYSADPQCQDLDLWCRMQLAGYKLVVSEDIWIRYRKVNWKAKLGNRIKEDRKIRRRYQG